MKTSVQKNRHIHLSGGAYRQFFRTKAFAQTTRVGMQYDERPVLGHSRRTADASRLSAGFRAKKPSVDPPPDPTSVSDRHRKQTDTNSQCHRPCQLSEVTNAKLP